MFKLRLWVSGGCFVTAQGLNEKITFTKQLHSLDTKIPFQLTTLFKQIQSGLNSDKVFPKIMHNFNCALLTENH